MNTIAYTPPEIIRYIDGGFFHISDKAAGKLARAASTKGKLPRHGYQIDVILSDGRKATLQRTRVTGYTWAPKRGWVWAVFALR